MGTDRPLIEHWQDRFLRAILWFIPRANPDIEPLYPQVRLWALELDEAGKPIREVGLGEGGTVLFRAPGLRNWGFWTDSPVTLAARDLEPLDQAEFEKLWLDAQERDA